MTTPTNALDRLEKLSLDVAEVNWKWDGGENEGEDEFLNAANPSTILTLIAVIRMQRKALGFYAARSPHHPLGGDTAKEAIAESEKLLGEIST